MIITIRKIKQNELEQAAKLIRKLSMYNIAELTLVDLYKNKDLKNELVNLPFIREVYEDKNGIVFVAAINKEIVGVIVGNLKKDDGDMGINLEISDLYVEEKVRDQGIGQKLIEKIETFAKTKGAILSSSYVFKNNSKSITFHEKNGYTQVAEILEFKKEL